MRFFNSYGPGEIPGRYRNVVPNFIYWALNGRPLPITGSGDETRDYTFVDDVVDGLLGGGLSDLAAGEAFNLAAGNEVPISELARMINELTGNSAGIAYGERRAWDRESRRLAATEKARNLLGFEAATPLAEGLARTVAWFRAHWEEIGEAADFASEPEAAGA
jgi:nucleoside-diphosphate-sugar epimerase